jgi:hypothetical protein
MIYKFTFETEGLTPEQVDELMDFIVDFAEKYLGGNVEFIMAVPKIGS